MNILKGSSNLNKGLPSVTKFTLLGKKDSLVIIDSCDPDIDLRLRENIKDRVGRSRPDSPWAH